MTEPVRPRLDPIRDELESREAAAVVTVGAPDEPTVASLQAAASESDDGRGAAPGYRMEPVAVAVTRSDVLSMASDGDGHAATRLADRLRADESVESDRLLTPATVPHDAALYLERAGFTLESTTVLDRSRARKTAAERDRLQRAQSAAVAGVERAATVLASASVADDHYVVDGESLTPARLRREVDAAVVTAGSFPGGRTSVSVPRDDETGATRGRSEAGEPAPGTDPNRPLGPGRSVVCAVAPRGPDGYHGGLVRTVVPGSDGGWERRAHVALTHAFRSARVMLTAAVRNAGSQDEESPTVTAVETELVAEARSFGFGEEVSASVHGVGREPHEYPAAPTDPVGPGTVVRLEASVRSADGIVRLADLLALEEADPEGEARWLTRPSRSLDPAVLAADVSDAGRIDANAADGTGDAVSEENGVADAAENASTDVDEPIDQR